jgi:HprK-related kinase A
VELAALPPDQLHARLANGDLLLRLGPFLIRIDADNSSFEGALRTLYAGAEVGDVAVEVADATFQLRRSGPATWLWLIDGLPPRNWSPFGSDLAIAQFEWAVHTAMPTALAPSLAVHAAVIADDVGNAIAMVGSSGSGKSTLAAGLVGSGFRLVADEFLIIAPDGAVVPMPGPITLKEASIEIIRQRWPQLVFGPVGVHPDRGPVCHVVAPATAGQEAAVRLRALLLPQYSTKSESGIEQTPTVDVFYKLVEQSHNRHILGPPGFRTLCALARLPTASLVFHDLDQGLAAVRSAFGKLQ